MTSDSTDSSTAPLSRKRRSKRLRILIADDDQILAETLAALLRLQAYDVRTAFSGKSAIQIASEFAPDTLIMDVMMPGLNGLEAASHIRMLLPGCKIFLITGRSVAADLVLKSHVLKDGFELLSKPIDPRNLLARL